jgi:hypothetical protein
VPSEVAVEVAVEVEVPVEVGVGVRVGVGVLVGVAVRVGVAVLVGVRVSVTVGVGVPGGPVDVGGAGVKVAVCVGSTHPGVGSFLQPTCGEQVSAVQKSPSLQFSV